MRQFISRFLYVLKGKRRSLVFLLLVFILTSFLEVIGIGIVGPFISIATNPNAIQQNYWLRSAYNGLHLTSETQFLIIVGVAVVVIFYVKSFLSFSAQKFVFEFGYREQGELSYRLMDAYLHAPYTFHLTRNSAFLIANITGEVDRFVSGLLMPLLTSISNCIVIASIMFLLVKTSPLAIVIIAGILPVAFLLFHYLKDRLKQWGEDVSKSRDELMRALHHGLGGVKETKIIGCESYFTQQYQEHFYKFGRSVALANSFSNLPRFVIEAFLITFLILFTFLFVRFGKSSSQDLTSVLGIFALAAIRLLPAMGNLLSSINGLRYNAYSLDKIYFDLKELEQIESSESRHSNTLSTKLDQHSQPFPFRDKVVLDRVAYCYPNTSKNALEEISLVIEKGQSIGLIGRSGAGKTTLVDVILGLLKPQFGDIQVDGASAYSDLRSWQNMIGYVPQSIFLTDDTLEKNVAFGVPANLIDQTRLIHALEAAQLTELVEQLPNGLQTMVGERGVLLSGGQRQRVGIARALYHGREILVFDEATAALDNETEGLVTEAIKSLSGIKTMIIIAHRLSTIEHCDRIYQLDKGRLVKSGKFEEVVSS